MKVRDTVPELVFGMFAGAAPPPKVTLCVLSNVKPTVPLMAMSTDTGENVLPTVLTEALEGNDAPVTVTTIEPCTVVEPAVAVAVIVEVPAETPVTTPVVALTVAAPGVDELQVTVAAMALPD